LTLEYSNDGKHRLCTEDNDAVVDLIEHAHENGLLQILGPPVTGG